MSHSKKSTRAKQWARVFPQGYDLRDGTRDGTRDAQNQGGDDNAADAEQANEEPQQDSGDNEGQGRDDGSVAPGYDGIQAQEQIINVSPDQAIKLVITSTETKKDAKKEHPQDRITKFWTNFEPEYLGGITQILPDTVGESTSSPAKKAQDASPKAVHSYENAKASCIKSVKRIIRECRATNQKYTDPHFDLERDLKVSGYKDCMYGLVTYDDPLDPGDVKRVTDFFENPQFYKDGAGFDDIVQGALGDCWFLAGLSTVTANQELLRKVCVIQDQDVGVYGFVFHRDGDWHPCIIDDKLYLSAPSFDESSDTVLEQYGVRQAEQEKLYQETLQKGSKALHLASCRDENETWVPLLEKAYAKAHGDYMAIHGGHVGEAIEDLTGGVTTEVYTTNILNKDDFWRDLCRIGKDFVFSCHVSMYSGWRGTGDYWDDKAREDRLKGILEGHAYSVLGTYEGYGQKLVRIRNPWGRTEWSGAWSDGSKEWTADWLHRLDHKFGDDGVFWMSYEDMLKKYKAMDRTRLFGPEWFVAQEWTSVQVPWSNRDYQSTTFYLDVPEDTDAVIVLSQLDTRYFKGLEGQYFFTMSFRVQKYDDEEDEDDYFARSRVNYELRRSTNVEVRLEKGKYTVLFKVEARKWYGKDDIETVIRNNITRRDKITQMATLYDLAFRKGKPPKEEKKEEPKPEEPTAANAAPQETKTTENQQPTTEAEKKDEAAKEKEKGEEEKEDKTEEKKEEKTEEAKADEKKEEVSESKKEEASTDKTEQPKPQNGSEEPPPAVMSGQTTTTQIQAIEVEKKVVADESDPDRSPWNASCVVGLRVYSKLAELKLKVLKPGDKPDGVTLDRDDIAKSALVEAENAQEKQETPAAT